jgi:hypothetical protein
LSFRHAREKFDNFLACAYLIPSLGGISTAASISSFILDYFWTLNVQRRAIMPDIRSFFAPKGGAAPAAKPAAKPTPKKEEESKKGRGSTFVKWFPHDKLDLTRCQGHEK